MALMDGRALGDASSVEWFPRMHVCSLAIKSKGCAAARTGPGEIFELVTKISEALRSLMD